MPGESLLFYVFAAGAVVASLMVIGQRNPIYSVLLLIASFAALAGLYVLLDAPFLAVIQIIIYAGAIMVLFLFVVMLLNAPREDAPGGATGAPARGPRRLGAILGLALFAELAWAVWWTGRDTKYVSAFAESTPAGDVTSVREIGRVLFSEYSLAFEVTSVLILAAMVGAVVLAKREIR
ncbi:MAG: NADH-quinone oxidoreductase subunit J [Vicinamibacterales bacterium]